MIFYFNFIIYTVSLDFKAQVRIFMKKRNKEIKIPGVLKLDWIIQKFYS